MLNQNAARLKIVLNQQNRFDYDEFKAECEKANTECLSIREWSQKVGMLSAAIAMFPDKEPAQAYTMFVNKTNTQPIPPIPRPVRAEPQPTIDQSGNIVVKAKPSCCGGGAVL